jgi:hypothetical protein
MLVREKIPVISQRAFHFLMMLWALAYGQSLAVDTDPGVDDVIAM